jgi:hypothetical protein
VRRLVREPREEDLKEVEQQRQIVTAELQVLMSLQVKATDSLQLPHSQDEDPCPQFFDDLDDEQGEPYDAVSVENPEIVPEHRPIPFPSNCLPPGHDLRAVELDARKRQARHYLNGLREVIADKSFQYSLLRRAANKAVRTRARGVIARLNNKITLYSRSYARARATLVRLGADDITLRMYQTLSKEDVRASSAILDPNEPGASTLRLRWIWQTDSPGSNNPAALRECECPIHM